MTGNKFDQEKIMLQLFPIRALEEVGRVLTFGANKYEADNWRQGISWRRLSGALLRHTFSFIKGETYDPESGLHHLAHAACCCLFLIEYNHSKKEFDDRAVEE